MSDAALQSDATSFEPPGKGVPLGRIRVAGGVRATLEAHERGTRVASLSERDGYRLRFPRCHDGLQGVIINTGGGAAGGDRVAIDLATGPGADALVTTQSAERIYRALDGSVTAVTIDLSAATGARLTWMPQETILFDGARLARRLSADIAADARLLIVEPIVFGRKAHGEALHSGSLADQWRIRRGGRLVLAESLRLDGDIARSLARPGSTDGAHVSGTAVYVAPDAEDHIVAVRAMLRETGCRIAASAWDGMLLVRAIARNAAPLRAALAALVPLLVGRSVPRVWQT